MYILLIDDDATFRITMERILVAEGHRVCWSATGRGGLALMRSENVDLVILDINLGPGDMTGWDVARDKLLDPNIRSIPLVVLSGLSPDVIRDGARVVLDAMSGTTMILGKPFELAVFRRVLQHLAHSKANGDSS